jgi:hypothetical protein
MLGGSQQAYEGRYLIAQVTTIYQKLHSMIAILFSIGGFFIYRHITFKLILLCTQVNVLKSFLY